MPSGNSPLLRAIPAFLASALITGFGLYFAVPHSAHGSGFAADQTRSEVLSAQAGRPAVLPHPAPTDDPASGTAQMGYVSEIEALTRDDAVTAEADSASQADAAPPADVVAPEPTPEPPPPPPAPPVVAARVAAPPPPPPPPPPAPSPTAAPPPAPVALSSLEQQIFNSQNAERAKAGLNPLRLDAGLEGVARTRAQDMVSKGYFSHVSPTGQTAFTLIDAAGINAPYAAENIGYNNYPDSTSASAVMSAFMASPSHRANILNPQYTRVGVAVVVRADGTKYYSIVFGGP